MSNTAKKIIILSTAIILAVVGILVFYPTIVAPPKPVVTDNLHVRDLTTSLNGFSDRQSYVFNDSVYNTVVDKIGLYRDEGFLNDQEIDYQVKSLVQKYIPVFTELCYDKFNAITWRESDHTAIRKRIRELKELTVDEGATKVVTGSFLTNLSDIEGIIDTYYEAKQAASYTEFKSVTDANSKIAKAENYQNTPYIKNCKALVDKLANVKINIGKSHYSYVERQVSSLRDYHNMTKEQFRNKANDVNNKISEYESNKSKYGSAAKAVTTLKNRASDLYKEAMAYYDRPEIIIDTNNQWTSIISPSSDYRAFQSTSNWHRSSSSATMSFKLKGYNSFSFRIRSDGEQGYDYVMVGKLNTMPTINNNYTDTKDNSNAGTAIYNYKTVTFNNLDKSTTYTIYVTYRKDSSNDAGDDRGFVLIPYAEQQ